MHPSQAQESIQLDIRDRSEMDSILDTAVQQLTQQATLNRRGILVTRSGPHNFTVSLHPDVPYGSTQEKMAWH